MSRRITKKDAKNALDTRIRESREKFHQGDYEYLLNSDNNIAIHEDDLHEMVYHLGGHIMRLNHQLGLNHMTRDEINEYHKMHGEGFFSDLWGGIKKVVNTVGKVVRPVVKIARPLVKPVGDIVGARYGAPGAGTTADETLKAVGLGIRSGGRYAVEGTRARQGGRFRSGGAVANSAVTTGQRRMRPEDYS